MAAYFLSDIHLKPFNDSRMQMLIQRLQEIESDAKEVFFLGDIFEFWMGGQKVWRERYGPFVEAVERLLEKNIRVYFFEGNHDIHVDKHFTKMGVPVFTDPQLVSLYGKTVRIEHGDFFNPDDKGYFFLRSFLRWGPMRWASTSAPGSWVTFFADWGVAQSHKRTSVEGRKPEVIADIKRRTRIYVEKVAHEQVFDLIIMGHTHVAEDYEVQVEGRKVHYINLGSWYVPQPKILKLTSQGTSYI